MPDQIWSYGPWAAAAFVVLLLGIPIAREQIKQRSEAERARRERQEQAEQAERVAREKERRDKDEQLILFLRESAADARQELKAQGAEFLKALERRDKLQEEIVKNLNGLSVLIEAQTRRTQR